MPYLVHEPDNGGSCSCSSDAEGGIVEGKVHSEKVAETKEDDESEYYEASSDESDCQFFELFDGGISSPPPFKRGRAAVEGVRQLDRDDDAKYADDDNSEHDDGIYNMPLWRRFGAERFEELPFGGLVPIMPEGVVAGKRGRRA